MSSIPSGFGPSAWGALEPALSPALPAHSPADWFASSAEGASLSVTPNAPAASVDELAQRLVDCLCQSG
jgi:hypothetical protein